MALCNLAAGQQKVQIVRDGAVRPLMFLSRFPDIEIQKVSPHNKRKPISVR